MLDCRPCSRRYHLLIGFGDNYDELLRSDFQVRTERVCEENDEQQESIVRTVEEIIKGI